MGRKLFASLAAVLSIAGLLLVEQQRGEFSSRWKDFTYPLRLSSKNTQPMPVILESSHEHTVHLYEYKSGVIRLQVVDQMDKQDRYIFENRDVVQQDCISNNEIPLRSLLDESKDSFYERKLENGSVPSFFRMKVSSSYNNKKHISFSLHTIRSDESLELLLEGTIPLSSESSSDVSAQIHFPTSSHFYGIPEHATSFSLQDGSFRLHNRDVFKYKLHDNGPLYGAVPFLLGIGFHENSKVQSVGMLWLNASDTEVKIGTQQQHKRWTLSSEPRDSPSRTAEWQSKGGIVDVFLFPGPKPLDVLRQHAEITGFSAFQPLFAMGYHQSRWNYTDENDVVTVSQKFVENNIPLDAIWLDIEHTDQKKYFTWDPYNFPTPDAMQKRISENGHHLVTITDPHIKRELGYYVHDEAVSNGYYVKRSAHHADVSDSTSLPDYVGHCWSGQSSWIDFLNPKAREWYVSLFSYKRYEHSSPYVHAWIDMNEPSVFDVEHGTMGDEAIHCIPTEYGSVLASVNHAQVHNLYGFYHAMATYEGLMHRNIEVGNPVYRPFILSRSFFAGSQRYTAVWTGDNTASWDHMNISLPMCLSLGVSNIGMNGADVGGFFDESGSVDEELLVRWYQLGSVLYTFFRGHSHHEAPRKEPYLFQEKTVRAIRSAISLRYQLLPYIYGLHYHSHISAEPVVRPVFFEFPEKALLDESSVAMLGDALLVCPVRDNTVSTTTCQLPSRDNHGRKVTWYSYPDGEVVSLKDAHDESRIAKTQIEIHGETIPMFIRSHSIVPIWNRIRRSTQCMVDPEYNPLTLQVALPGDWDTLEGDICQGRLYLDDYATMEYKTGAYGHRTFIFKKQGAKTFNLVNSDTKALYKPHPDTVESAESNWQNDIHHKLTIEKIELFGVTKSIQAVYVQKSDDNSRVPLDFHVKGTTLRIRGKGLLAVAEWQIIVET